MSNNGKKPGPRQSGSPVRREAMQRVLPQTDVDAATQTVNYRSPVPPIPQPQGPPPQIMRQLEEHLQGLIQSNAGGLRALAQRGINFDPNQLTNARIDHVIMAVAGAMGPNGPAWALQARIAFEEQMAQEIERGQREGTKAQLSMGAAFSPEAIRRLARETGTFGGL